MIDTNKKLLRINFTDFWEGFEKTNNFFYHLLSERYDLVISENPELLIFSVYGRDHQIYNCTKLFYTAENSKSNFNVCDYSISFENLPTLKQYQLPHYVIRVLESNDLKKLEKQLSRKEAEQILAAKTDFCCTVVSNPNALERNEFFEMLNQVKKVNSGGRYKNNVGGPVENKRAFCNKHKFVFAFENEKASGYLTEKLTDALLSNAIPIYSGDPNVAKTFNSNRFINYDEFQNKDDLIKTILDLDGDDDRFIEMLKEPVFCNRKTPDFFDSDRLLDFITICINDNKVKSPFRKRIKKTRYWLQRKYWGFLVRLNIPIPR